MSTETNLSEAQAAYHKLATGRALVSVTIDGIQTQYTQANMSVLKTYITSLQATLGATTGRTGPGRFF